MFRFCVRSFGGFWGVLGGFVFCFYSNGLQGLEAGGVGDYREIPSGFEHVIPGNESPEGPEP